MIRGLLSPNCVARLLQRDTFLLPAATIILASQMAPRNVESRSGSWSPSTRYIAACASGGTSLMPCAGAVDTIAPGQTATMRFTVANTNSGSVSYAVTCSFAPPISSCAVDQAAITVQSNAPAQLNVSYTAASSAGAGTVILNLDGGGADAVSTSISVKVAAAAIAAP